MYIYTCTSFGHQYFRVTLNLGYMPYDENVVFRADSETFKHLAVNQVCLIAGTDKRCTGLFFNGKYDMREYKENKAYVYAAAEYGDTVYLFEPAYFKFDKRIETAQEVREMFGKRMLLLEKTAAEYAEKLQKQARVVFVVENLAGLKKALDITSKSESRLIRESLYTCENVLYRNHWALDRSFLMLDAKEDYDDGKIHISAVGKKWL